MSSVRLSDSARLSVTSVDQDHRQWLGGVMVTASDLRSTGRGFDSRPFHYQVATVGQLLFAPWAWAYSTLHP